MIYEVKMKFEVIRFCEVEADNEDEARDKANAMQFEHEGPDADVHNWECLSVKESK
jgi:hypothetical protein